MLRRVLIAVGIFGQRLGFLCPLQERLRLIWPLVFVAGLALLLQTGCATLQKATFPSMTWAQIGSSTSAQPPEIQPVATLPFSTPQVAEIAQLWYRFKAYLGSLSSSDGLRLEAPYRNKEL